MLLLISIIIITPAETWKLPLINRKGFQIPMDPRAYALASHKPCDVQTAFMMECTAVATAKTFAFRSHCYDQKPMYCRNNEFAFQKQYFHG